MEDIFNGLTDKETAKLKDYLGLFRTTICDYDKEKNILDGKQLDFTDTEIYRYLKRAIRDINSGAPRTSFTIYNITDDELLIEGAVVFALMGRGLLQLRNQLSYSDGGLSVDMFNKTGAYSEWARLFLQMYAMSKATFKSSVIPSSYDAGFGAVSSEFAYYFGEDYY